MAEDRQLDIDTSNIMMETTVKKIVIDQIEPKT